MNLEQKFSDWQINNPYIIFGNYNLLEEYLPNLNIKYIIDNNPEKWGMNEKLGLEIKSPDALRENKYQVIIANQWASSIQSIAVQLRKMGLKENSEFTTYKKLLSLWAWKYENKLLLPYTEYILTTKCSLKCKNCILFIPYYVKAQHVTLKEFKEDLDIYFKHIDRVLTFRLLGGEPFLHPNLEECLRYIGERYRDKINHVELVSNGMICPKNEQIFHLCKKYKIKIHISNYTEVVNYKNNLNKFIEKLEQYDIEYENALPDKWSWKKVQSPLIENNLNERDLKSLFINCQNHCRALRDKKLYYCAMQSSATNANLFIDDNSDYIDLQQRKNIEKFIQFELGDFEKGYISFCKRCLGIGSTNSHYVIPGEQIWNSDF